jgi:Flp pilus assembly protein TadG
MKNWKTRELTGSFTIELAAIMPVIFLVLILSIRLTFYFYDKCILAGMADEIAVTAAEKIRSGEEDLAALETIFGQTTGKKLLILKDAEVTIDKRDSIVMVEVKAVNGTMKSTAAATAPIDDVEEYIRKYLRLGAWTDSD